jgi:hypothetical protein
LSWIQCFIEYNFGVVCYIYIYIHTYIKTYIHIIHLHIHKKSSPMKMYIVARNQSRHAIFLDIFLFITECILVE